MAEHVSLAEVLLTVGSLAVTLGAVAIAGFMLGRKG